MPPLKLTPTERQNRLLVGRIRMDQTMKNESWNETARVMGVCPNTVRNRFDDPGSFNFDELRRLAKHYGWNREILAEFFGV